MKHTPFLFVVAFIMLLTGCTPSGFTIKGSLDDALQGSVMLGVINVKEQRYDSLAWAPIVDGKFTLSGRVDSLVEANLWITIEGKEDPRETDSEGRMVLVSHYWNNYYPVYVENANYTVHYGEAGVQFEGSETMNLVSQFMAIRQRQEVAHPDLYPKIRVLSRSDEEREEDPAREQARMERQHAINEIIWAQTAELVNKHRNSPATAFYLSQYKDAFPPQELKKSFARLGEAARNTSSGRYLQSYLNEVLAEIVNKEPLFSGTASREYVVDKAFSGSTLTGFLYLAPLPDDRVAGLRADGTVVLFDEKGRVVRELQSGVNPAAVLAVDPNGNYYVVGKILGDAGDPAAGRVRCVILNPNGTKNKEYAIADFGIPSGAKVSEETLYIADTRNRMIGIYDAATGVKKNEIPNLRTCCGILDFSLSPDNRVLVANLGAFRVDYFNSRQEQIGAFGQRGRDAQQFHGCCNPVNVACLSDGSVLSVEKDPTRIKVYHNENEATVIEGVKELVKGCSYIPLAVDSRDNIYLASPADGVVRCIVQ